MSSGPAPSSQAGFDEQASSGWQTSGEPGADGGSEASSPENLIIPDRSPDLPVRATVVFPGTVTSLGILRLGSRRLLDESLPRLRIIGVVTQRNTEEEEPASTSLYEVGTTAVVLKLIRQPDDSISVIVQGLSPVRVVEYTQHEQFSVARVQRVDDVPGTGDKFLMPP